MDSFRLMRRDYNLSYLIIVYNKRVFFIPKPAESWVRYNHKEINR